MCRVWCYAPQIEKVLALIHHETLKALIAKSSDSNYHDADHDTVLAITLNECQKGSAPPVIPPHWVVVVHIHQIIKDKSGLAVNMEIPLNQCCDS